MPFTEDFQRLYRTQPKYNLRTLNNHNADYVNCTLFSKSCYLITDGLYLENCLYGEVLKRSRDLVDCDYCVDSELCYESVDCEHCYSCDFSKDCKNCVSCTYCHDCIGCEDCFGCINLKRKKFYIFNTAYSEEDYKKQVKTLSLKSKELQTILNREFIPLCEKEPHVYSYQSKTDHCTGNHIYNSKDSHYCFDAVDVDDCLYFTQALKNKDCCDMTTVHNGELCYECRVVTNAYNCNFLLHCKDMSNSEFCSFCFSCKHCFGCTYLQQKEYHILNKPYTPEEYEKMIVTIKKELKESGQYGLQIFSAGAS